MGRRARPERFTDATWSDTLALLGAFGVAMPAAFARVERFDDAVWAEALTHRGLVATIAMRYEHRGLDREDLDQVGLVGVCRALVRFDPARAKFSTYAALWIKEAMRSAIRTTGTTIRIPAHAWQLARKDPGTLSRPKALAFALAARHAVHDWDYPETFEELVAVEPAEADLDHADRLARLPALLALLDDRERSILAAHYGLGGDAPRSQRQIGDAMGHTGAHIGHIERRAIRKLREAAGAGRN